MADITKEMFSEYEIKINGKSDVEQTLLRIFLFCGFDLTVNEIQEFMDIKPHYIYSNIKSEFDYIICPKHSTQIFKKINKSKDTISPCESFIYKDSDESTSINVKRNDIGSLSRVRMLISRDSFLRYLIRDLKIAEARIRFEIKDEDIPHNITSRDIINILDNLEYLSPIYAKVHIILRHILFDHTKKLRSPSTLRKELTEINDGAKIHDTQMYRWLRNKATFARLELTSVSEKNPVVRYYVDPSTYKEDKCNKNLFSIDSRQFYVGVYDEIVSKMQKLSFEKKLQQKKDTNK